MRCKKTTGAVTAELKDLAESCGQCQFTPEQSAIICRVPVGKLEQGALADIYLHAKLLAELAVRRVMLQKAQDGDGQAQREFLRLADESRIELDED